MIKMKDSGVEWIGEIPYHWETIRFWQSINKMGTGLNPRENFELTKDDEYYYVTIKNFKNGKLFLDDKCDRISENAWGIIQERSDLKKGDILFASISKDSQAYILEEDPYNWNINESVFCIRPNELFLCKYFYYQLINSAFYDDLRLDATGTTFQSIKQKKIRQSTIVLPPKMDQQRIVNYLDDKCAKIDAIIEKQQAVIEKLKEYKLSIITEAVTKGLNHNVEMKDSGIDWIGAIPEHWNIAKISRIATVVRGASPRPAGDPKYFNGHDVPWITVAEVTKGEGKYIYETKEYLTFAGAEKSRLVEAGTLLLSNSGATLGVPKITTITGCINDGSVAFYNLGVNQLFLLYVFKSRTYELRKQMAGYGQPNLNTDIIKSISIPIPSDDEQIYIVEYLDSKCTVIDTTIEKRCAIIDKLIEYKKSLIYEVVTGKKEV